ncbi:MAG: OsmC family protein [Sneathiella sp.]|uniref:OsmC family protein n=1 Tax=Sneathiella sp. TaxID=1964365 RepID=UPI0030025111
MSVEHIQNSVKDVIAYLQENPKDALSNDAPITAVMENGLRCRATCDATRIALHAAQLGVTLDTLEVTADSVSDDRGLLGLDDSVPAGPLSLRTRVTIGAAGVTEEVLREIVDYAVTHSPVADGCRRATPSKVEIKIA